VSPAWLTGGVERLFFTILIGLFTIQGQGLATAMMGWIGIKMAINWNRADQNANPDARAFGFSAALAGLVSLGFALWGGSLISGENIQMVTHLVAGQQPITTATKNAFSLFGLVFDPNWLTAISTGVMAIFTVLVLLVYRQIAWFTGSMESYSEVNLRLEAKRGIDGEPPINIICWDPTVEELPKREHRQPVDLGTIYIFVPRKDRQNTFWRKLSSRFLSYKSDWLKRV
jgi:hypothetical protein